MNYSDFISVDKGFQYSINLAFDLYKQDKVKGYIPTSTSIELMEGYLKEIYSPSNDKATVLIGPYGKGKSHLMLVIMSILSSLNEDDSNLIAERIRRINFKAGELCSKVIEEKIKFLPIIINGNLNSLEQAFLLALSEALKAHGLEDLLPDTYFDSIIRLIDEWEKNLKDLYEIFNNELSKNGYSIKRLKQELKEYNKLAYELFTQIYKTMCSGLEYNPFINSDVIKLFDNINYKLVTEHGYKGIFVVFDEFSKFLESSNSSNSFKDLKLLQDFAELANRSTSNQQLFLTCITHKSINEYIRQMPKNMINAWRAIEGRFKEIYYTSNLTQNYELIANAIIKDTKKFDNYLSKNENGFNEKIKQYYGIFKSLYTQEEYIRIIGEKCFPLNPISVFILPQISEKVAQNERTLFTYLSKNEKNTLAGFIDNNKGALEWLNVESIYDYFEDLFKKELFNENIYSLWKKGDAIIRACNNADEISIIKALVLFNIIEDVDNLPSTDENIRLSLDMNDQVFNNAIESLITERYIYINRNSGIIDFTLCSDKEVFDKIETIKNSKVRNYNIGDEISNIKNPQFVVPKRYNDEYKMVRFFPMVFLTSEVLKTYHDVDALIDKYHGDGIIINLIYFDGSEIEECIEHVKLINDIRIILNIPAKTFDKEEAIKEYIALNLLKEDKEFLADYKLSEQLIEIMQEEIIDEISEYTDKYYVLNINEARIFHDGNIASIKKRADLNQLVSKICKEYYSLTPIINNEMINKDNITKPIMSARKKIIEYLLNSEQLDKDTMSEGKGPEATIYRALIVNKGLEGIEDNWDSKLKRVIDEIKGFIINSQSNRRCFNELYSILQGKDFGIRRGIIPVYLSYVFRNFKNDLVISVGERNYTEIPLSSEVLNNINENPKDYFVYIDSDTKDKDSYVTSLKNLFTGYIDEKAYWENKFYAICNGMQRYVQSLSQYSKTHRRNLEGSELSKGLQKFRAEAVKYDLNPRDFIFKKLLKLTGTNNYQECINEISTIKGYLDESLSALKNYIVDETMNIVNSSYNGSLIQGIKNWYFSLEEYKRKTAYNNMSLNKLLGLIVTIDTYNDYEALNQIAYIITGLSIEDWSDKTVNEYITTLKEFVDLVNRNDNKMIDDINGKVITISIPIDNDVIEKRFESSEISDIGETLSNQIEEAFDEYGEAIDDNEKRSILIKMLQKYL